MWQRSFCPTVFGKLLIKIRETTYKINKRNIVIADKHTQTHTPTYTQEVHISGQRMQEDTWLRKLHTDPKGTNLLQRARFRCRRATLTKKQAQN